MAAGSRHSAGILLYRRGTRGLQVFLVHPGGPFWARKDDDAWSIPKGECAPGEDPLLAAQREFREETGMAIEGPFLLLPAVRQAGGKTVTAWALEGDLDPTQLRSNTFTLQWPPGSGAQRTFPEVDRGDWFELDEARRKLLSGQGPLLDALLALVGA
jgi:predicted NUDIX family NTP pyrophosphohydrolase